MTNCQLPYFQRVRLQQTRIWIYARIRASCERALTTDYVGKPATMRPGGESFVRHVSSPVSGRVDVRRAGVRGQVSETSRRPLPQRQLVDPVVRGHWL